LVNKEAREQPVNYRVTETKRAASKLTEAKRAASKLQ
jgi:hypothetical protein